MSSCAVWSCDGSCRRSCVVRFRPGHRGGPSSGETTPGACLPTDLRCVCARCRPRPMCLGDHSCPEGSRGLAFSPAVVGSCWRRLLEPGTVPENGCGREGLFTGQGQRQHTGPGSCLVRLPVFPVGRNPCAMPRRVALDCRLAHVLEAGAGPAVWTASGPRASPEPRAPRGLGYRFSCGTVPVRDTEEPGR